LEGGVLVRFHAVSEEVGSTMALRLLCRLPQRLLRYSLVSGEYLVGADPACPIHLPHPTVGYHHARLRVSGHQVEVEDCGSRGGTYLDGQRIQGSVGVASGDSVHFGLIAAEIEEIPDGDDEAAFRMAPRSQAEEAVSTEEGSSGGEGWGGGPLETFYSQSLPTLLDELAAGASEIRMAARVGAALWHLLPCISLELRPQQPAGAEPWFVARRGEGSPSAASHVRDDDRVRCEVCFPPTVSGASFLPLLEVGLRLIRLARRSVPHRKAPQHATPSSMPALPNPETVHPEVRLLYDNAARIASGDVSVLIRGESGTGKEVLARFIHQASGRDPTRLVALNCAALPRDLLEAELFGIESRVATGVDARPGKFEMADGGTLFLDEIGDMAPATQARILRVLQEKTVYRLGAEQPRRVAVRILAATNRDLESMIDQGTFRRDLYYRIAAWEVELPPLRQRPRDIPNLAAYFLEREAVRLGRRELGISRSAMEALATYPWPGNIRELHHEIARGVLLLADGDLLETRQLRPAVVGGRMPSPQTLQEAIQQAERQHIQHTVQETQGRLGDAARVLGISRSTLYRRMRSLDLLQD
jgi:DNA-binding NtrC family response regulator